jgi:hypothetical protein
VLLAFICAVVAWEHRPAPRSEEMPAASLRPVPPAAPQASGQRLQEAVEQCARKSDEEFRKSWSPGLVHAGGWSEAAGFASHYNPKLDVCFYLVTVTHYLSSSGVAALVQSMLFDANEGELYGEYSGPAAGGSPGQALPDSCRMTAFYCASKSEWDRVADSFMESAALDR